MTDQIRITTSGPIQGFIDTSIAGEYSNLNKTGSLIPVQKWLGIPYAQAERFKRPSPPTPWTELLLTQEFGTMFPQPRGGTDAIYGNKRGVIARNFIKQSEKSHFINVFTPANHSIQEKLPVLVWIYGGSLATGSADRFLYDPTEWIRRTEAENGQRFIVVTGNYRLNVFGFCSSQDLLEVEGESGNYGLYDSEAIFEWVHANANAFGFDTTRITAFGESAGAFLVAALLISQKRLFTRAILESGAPGTMQIRPIDKAYGAYEALLSHHGKPSLATAEARINYLRSLSTEGLSEAHNENQTFGGVGLTIESGEDKPWNAQITEILDRRGCDEWITEVIIGTNEDEGTMFDMLMPMLRHPKGFAGYIARFPPAEQARYEALYPPSAFDGLAATNYIDSPVSKVIAEQLFINPARRLAETLAQKSPSTTVYMYRCREIVERLMTPELSLGAMHSIEIPLIFNINSLWEEGSKEAATSKKMGDAWINFATTGKPEGGWEAFTIENQSWLAFNENGETRLEVMEK